MRNSLFAAALGVSLTLAVAAPAFAGELTGYRITKPAEAPCHLTVQRAYQIGNIGPVHVRLANTGKYYSVGKLVASTLAGTSAVMDGSDFKLEAGASADLIVSKNPRGTVTGPKLMLAFTECTVAMS